MHPTILLTGSGPARRCWQNFTPAQRARAVCLPLCPGSPLDRLASTWNLPRWEPAPFEPERQERHLREYLAVMDALAGTNGHLPAWWSTHLSRKNVTSSPLPTLFWQLVQALEAHARARRDDRPLLVLDPPWPVVAALVADEGARFRHCGGTLFLRWGYRWRGRRAAWGELLRDTLATLRRILLFRWRFHWTPGPAFTPPPPGAPHTLLKSFAYARSFTEQGFRDPFFGPLADHLRESVPEAPPLTVVIAAEQPGLCFARLRRLPRQDVIPLEHFMRLGETLAEALRLLFRPGLTRFRAPEGAMFLNWPCTPLLEEVLAAGGWRLSLYQHLHLHGGRRWLQHHPGPALLLPWEGNPWEKRLIAGARAARPEIRVGGMQHAVVSREHAGAFVSATEARTAPVPDRLLTTGPATATLFHHYGALPVQVACALRQANLPVAVDPAPIATPLVVLVPLEGLWEVLPLVAYVLDQAPMLPHIQFRLRPHPVLPVEKLLARLGRDLPAGGAVTRSNAPSVAEDLKDAGVILYSRTTVALESLARGKPLIHFDSGGLFGEDPLFEFTAYKWTVHRGMALGPVLETILSLPEGERQQRFNQARGFLAGYFVPATPTGMEPFLPRSLAHPLP